MKCICELINKGDSAVVLDAKESSLSLSRNDQGYYYLMLIGEGRDIAFIRYCPYCGRDFKID